MAEDVYYIETDITPQWADDAVSWEPVDHDPFPKPVPIQAAPQFTPSELEELANTRRTMDPAYGNMFYDEEETPYDPFKGSPQDYVQGNPVGYQWNPGMFGIYGRDIPTTGDEVIPTDYGNPTAYMPNVERRRGATGNSRIQEIGFNTPQQPMTQEEIDQFVNRPPRALDIPSASPAEAWFEEPLWPRGGEPLQPQAKYAPVPNPQGLSGGYGGQGKFFAPWNFRGAYRHSIPF